MWKYCEVSLANIDIAVANAQIAFKWRESNLSRSRFLKYSDRYSGGDFR